MSKILTLLYLLAVTSAFSFLSCSPLKQSDSNEIIRNEALTEMTVLSSTDLFDDNFWLSLASYGPDIQVSLHLTCRALQRLIDFYRPYQRRLSLNLSIPGLADLPLHPDLLLFEGLHFAKNFAVDALAFVYRLTRVVLRSSPIFERVLTAVFDKAAELAQFDSLACAKFLDISRFSLGRHADSLFVHFVEGNNLVGYLALKQACGESEQPLSKDIQKLKYFAPLAAYLKDHPSDFNLLFDGQLSAFSMLALFSTELPVEKIMETLDPWLKVASLKRFRCLLRNAFRFDYSQLPLPTSVYEFLLFETIKYTRGLQEYQTDSKSFKSLERLISCRFSSESLVTADNVDVLESDLLQREISLIYTYGRRFEEAAKHLPDLFHQGLSNAILKNEEFCAFLAQTKPEWIRNYYAGRPSLLYGNRDMLFAFLDITSLDQFFAFATQDELLSVAPLIYEKGSLEEVQAVLARTDLLSLQDHYITFLEVDMPNERFLAIIQLFLQKHRSIMMPMFDEPAICSLSEGRFILLFGEDSPVRDELVQRPFDIEFAPGSGVIVGLLNSTELGPKLLAARHFLMLHFKEDMRAQLAELRSPLEITHGFRISGHSLVDFLRDLFLSFVQFYYADHQYHFFDLAVTFIGFVKILDAYESSELEEYLDSDRFIDALQEFETKRPFNLNIKSFHLIRRLYAAASPRLKLIMQVALSRAEELKRSISAEAEMP